MLASEKCWLNLNCAFPWGIMLMRAVVRSNNLLVAETKLLQIVVKIARQAVFEMVLLWLNFEDQP
jgi:hypothetical protein